MEILNLKGHQNLITGSRVTTILLKKVNFPVGQNGEASRWSVCNERGLPRLVCFYIVIEVRIKLDGVGLQYIL